MNANDERWVSAARAATIAGVTVSAVYQAAARGDLVADRIGYPVRFDVRSVRRYARRARRTYRSPDREVPS